MKLYCIILSISIALNGGESDEELEEGGLG